MTPLVHDTGSLGGAGARGHGSALAKAAPDPTVDIAGLAIRASVSDEVDARILEQVKAGAWPSRLKAEDWTSGSINWLLDVIASDRAATARVVTHFGQVVKGGDLRLHPQVAGLVEKGVLEGLGARRQEPNGEPPDGPPS